MRTDIYAKVISLVCSALKPAQWEIPSDFLSYEHFLRVVKDVNMNSSPGYPYLLSHSTNRDLFECDKEGKPSAQALQRIWSMVQHQIKTKKSDYIRIFIKPEPLSPKKRERKSYRIINSVSIVDQIIDAMLFKDLNDLLIKNHNQTPVKTGWSPFVGGWKEVPRRKVISTDKSAWDWTVFMWMLEAELEVRKRLCKNLNKQWVELAEWRYHALFVDPTFITSGGYLFKQNQPGIMKSGCKNTITSNSIMQLILHYRVSLELGREPNWLWAMGDDVIMEEEDDEYFDLLSQYCNVKEITPLTEFAGFRFIGSRVEPLYRAKHAFMLLHQDEKFHVETADAYALLYHRSAYRKAMRAILRQLNPDLIDEDLLDIIWDAE
uniref:RdRp catalytic domain-containing protein n=1 Tax=Mortimer virus TaxID=2600330 RepID=A0A5B8XAJ5_9VIRU|nr:hypothetical protein 1 [Mortimer virus]